MAVSPSEPTRAPIEPSGPGLNVEWVIAPLVLIFGLIFVFLMPPCQAPDEAAHFLRAYHVSDGNLVPGLVDNRGGGEIPRSILQVPAAFANLPLRTNNQTSRESFSSLWSLPLAADDRQPAPFPSSSYYSFVPYIPQALGIAAARALGAGPLAIFYAGRLANLALSVCLIFWTLRLTPIAKLTFGIVALIPMTVHQLGSQSPDASAISAGFFLSALMLRAAVQPGPRLRWPAIALLFGVSAWLTLCKFPYAVVSMLYLAVPAERLGGRRRYLTVGFSLMLLVGSLAFLETQFKKFTGGGIPLPRSALPASIDGQLDFIRHDPLGYARVIAETTAEHGRIWMDQLGMLGWLDTFVNPMAMHLLFIFVLVIVLSDHAMCGIIPPLRLRLVSPLCAILCWLVVLTAVYVCGCPVRAKLMNGIQGRYFLPFTPLLLLPLSNRMIVVQARPHVLLGLVAAMGAGVLAVAQVNTFRRYYLPPPAQVYMSPLALGIGALVAGTIGVAVVRTFRPGDEMPVPAAAETVEEALVPNEPECSVPLGA
jgi:uncharacterized membrane protein